jgi:hypothetical protein
MISSGFLHRKAKSLLGDFAALLVVGSVVSIAAAQPKDSLRYKFDPSTDLSNIKDASGNGHNGMEMSGDPSLAFLVSGHKGDPMAALFQAGQATNGIDTGVDTTTLGLDNKAFTVMAFVNRATIRGDNFVFGTDQGNSFSLHLGFRDKVTYMAFWGNDSAGPIVGAFQWHHLAQRFDPTVGGGSQDIFLDGVLVAHSPGHKGFVGDGTTSLKVGRGHDPTGGAFAGAIEDARVFAGVALRDDQILAAATDQAIPP